MKGIISFDKLSEHVEKKYIEVYKVYETALEIANSVRDEAINEMLIGSTLNTFDSYDKISISSGTIAFDTFTKVINFEIAEPTPKIEIEGLSALQTFRRVNEIAEKCDKILSKLEKFLEKAKYLDEIYLEDFEINYLMSSTTRHLNSNEF